MTTTANGEGADKNEERYGKPEYRIAFVVYDEKVDEVVCKGDTYVGAIHEDGWGVISCPSAEQELFSTLRHFKNKARDEFEAVHYPKEYDSE